MGIYHIFLRDTFHMLGTNISECVNEKQYLGLRKGACLFNSREF